MRYVKTTLLLLFLQSCLQDKRNSHQDSIPLESCTQVNMIYFNHNDTLTYQTSDSLEIATLTELLSNSQNIIGDSCEPSGRLIYMNNGNPIITAEFSTTNSNEGVDCNFISFESNKIAYKHKLTYRAVMFIDDILWHKLKWSSLIDHGPIRLHGDTGNVENKESSRVLLNLVNDSAK